MASGAEAFTHHLDRCDDAVLPGGRFALSLDGHPIGFVDPFLARDPAMAEWLSPDPDGERCAVGSIEALRACAHALADRGRIVLRGEAFDVRSDRNGATLGTLDRGALPAFGIAATGVHLNGLVETADGASLWVARRAADKLLDPGKLDHLAAGGVAAGHDAPGTLAKEAAEECGLGPPELAAAREVARIRYRMNRPEGLRRDLLVCYDVVLPPGWTPVALDGEVEAFELWPLERALRTVRDTEDFKFNVNLVLIDLFLRRGLIDVETPSGRALRARLDRGGGGAVPG